MKLTLLIFLLINISLWAADLPDKGITPPQLVTVPDSHAINPEINEPIGNGLAVIVVFGIIYAVRKRKFAQ